MTPQMSEDTKESRRQRNEMSPLGNIADDGVPAIVPPAKMVRLQIPDATTAAADVSVQQLASDMQAMHGYFKTAIEHVVGFVDANTNAIAGIRGDVNHLKIAVKESPTLMEFQDLERGLTTHITATANSSMVQAEVEAMGARLDGIVAEVKSALELLDQANTERIEEVRLVKEIESRFHDNVTRDGTGLLATARDLEVRVRLLEKTADKSWRVTSAGATGAACGPATTFENEVSKVVEAEIVKMQSRIEGIDASYTQHYGSIAEQIHLLNDATQRHEGLIQVLQAASLGPSGAPGPHGRADIDDGSGCPHCIHVTRNVLKIANIEAEMAEIKAKIQNLSTNASANGQPASSTPTGAPAYSQPSVRDAWGGWNAATATPAAGAPGAAAASASMPAPSASTPPTSAPQPPPGVDGQWQHPGGPLGGWNGRWGDAATRPLDYGSRVFDDKVATSDLYRYNGADGDGWRQRTRNFLISKVPALEPILFWAEHQGSTEIPPDRLQAAVMAHNWRLDTDVVVLSGLIWGFLNSACQDKARIIFDNASRMNGLDAWRRLCFRIDLGSDSRIRELQRQIDRPPAFKNIEGVLTGLEEWDTLLRKMREAGGELPSDRRLRDKLLEMLPSDLQKEMLFRASASPNYEVFRECVRSGAVEWMNIHRRTGAHSLEEDMEDDDFLAVAARKGFTVTKRPAPGPKKTPGPPGPKRPIPKAKAQAKAKAKCTNCGSDKHSIAQCTRPIVPVSERPCFTCGKRGHPASRCPDKPATRVNNIDDDEDGEDEQYEEMCLEELSDGVDSNDDHDLVPSKPASRPTSRFASATPWSAFRDDESDSEDNIDTSLAVASPNSLLKPLNLQASEALAAPAIHAGQQCGRNRPTTLGKDNNRGSATMAAQIAAARERLEELLPPRPTIGDAIDVAVAASGSKRSTLPSTSQGGRVTHISKKGPTSTSTTTTTAPPATTTTTTATTISPTTTATISPTTTTTTTATTNTTTTTSDGMATTMTSAVRFPGAMIPKREREQIEVDGYNNSKSTTTTSTMRGYTQKIMPTARDTVDPWASWGRNGLTQQRALQDNNDDASTACTPTANNNNDNNPMTTSRHHHHNHIHNNVHHDHRQHASVAQHPTTTSPRPRRLETRRRSMQHRLPETVFWGQGRHGSPL